MDSKHLLEVRRRLQHRFEHDRQILSFDQWFDLFCANPRQQGRSIAEYLLDVFDHFGTLTVQRPYGEARRFKLFDMEFDGAHERLVGHEEVQNDVYTILQNFVRQGRVNKLVLLHGPNGSAKSTFIHCLVEAFNRYSRVDEGALYRFNWIFPSDKASKTGIGFGDAVAGDATAGATTFAHLDEDDVSAKLTCEMSDPPLFLIPKDERAEILGTLAEEAGDGGSWSWPNYLKEGDLCHKCRQIFDALLIAYHGDYARVLRHAQVERLYVSQRYRRAAVTIEPQLSVDARLRQVTVDRSFESLPAALQNVRLFEPYGALADANRGILEFNDLFKRPVEAFKYILSTCEKSTVNLETSLLFLDCFFIGSANEKHLQAFKEVPDFQAFKGRIELVRVPYLLNYEHERQIYADQVERGVVDTHMAPHTTLLAALWAVLTRLKKPQPERFSEGLRDVIGRLTPLEKAELYAKNDPPRGLAPEATNELLNAVRALWVESDSYPNYEGLLGASPREVKTLLLNAGQNPGYKCISPLAFFEELEQLVEDRTTYAFLQLDPVGDYHHPRAFIDVVKARYLALVDEEVREATGLVEESSYLELFERYVLQVKHFVQGEKVQNPITGESSEADEDFMEEVEKKLELVGSPEDFRHQFFNKIGAWGHENPGQVPDLNELFPIHIEQLRDSYFQDKSQVLEGIFRDILRLDAEGADALQDEDRERAEQTLATMTERFGYCEHCAREAVSFLLREQRPN
jgi:serine protein kinase